METGESHAKGCAIPARRVSDSFKTFEGENEFAGSEANSKKFSNPFAQANPAITNGAAETEEDRGKMRRVLQLEADIAHQEGRRVPALDFF
ncbi:mitochondrial ribonuclease P protein 1 homolog [Drosophila miranda]|uniref:mitochondrial ribonuclease P protein 1 homolog n=1 Tax=Drosophila miranda TaxID=7229 RepID=UPI00143F537B|nr:mitochondrial ribonuclease P protein 1 homolog [Drosophila miranda]